jgi:hypothetical protein
MKTQETYNGWPNRQTWNVMLWMDNDEGAYRAYREKVERYKAAGRRFGGVAARAVCQAVFGDQTPDGVRLSSRVKWGAIAEAMREV